MVESNRLVMAIGLVYGEMAAWGEAFSNMGIFRLRPDKSETIFHTMNFTV